jgi:hypothetical protein
MSAQSKESSFLGTRRYGNGGGTWRTRESSQRSSASRRRREYVYSASKLDGKY